jgi:hypothetical protein
VRVCACQRERETTGKGRWYLFIVLLLVFALVRFAVLEGADVLEDAAAEPKRRLLGLLGFGPRGGRVCLFLLETHSPLARVSIVVVLILLIIIATCSRYHESAITN